MRVPLPVGSAAVPGTSWAWSHVTTVPAAWGLACRVCSPGDHRTGVPSLPHQVEPPPPSPEPAVARLPTARHQAVHLGLPLDVAKPLPGDTFVEAAVHDPDSFQSDLACQSRTSLLSA